MTLSFKKYNLNKNIDIQSRAIHKILIKGNIVVKTESLNKF